MQIGVHHTLRLRMLTEIHSIAVSKQKATNKFSALGGNKLDSFEEEIFMRLAMKLST